MRAVAQLLKRAFVGGGRPDYTDDGERVDIDLTRGEPDYEAFDIYEKSHFRRYQFASTFLDPGMLVGDFACGTAYGTVMLARRARHAYGCDLNPRVIRMMARRYRKVANLTLLNGDILEVEGVPPLDFVVSFETVEHFDEALIPRLFAKFNGLLKPGGRLLFSTPYMQPRTEAGMKHHRTFDIDEERLRGWMRDAGFRVDGFRYQDYQSHDVVEALDAKDFILCLCHKE